MKRTGTLVLLVVLMGCGAGLDARAIQGGLLGAASGALIGAGAGGGSGALIGAGAGALGGTLMGARLGHCEENPEACQQARMYYPRYPRVGYPGRGYGYDGGRHYQRPYGRYGYGGGRISCNYRCESWDSHCQRARGQCEGQRRALEEQARDPHDYAREGAHCAGGRRDCRRPR